MALTAAAQCAYSVPPPSDELPAIGSVFLQLRNGLQGDAVRHSARFLSKRLLRSLAKPFETFIHGRQRLEMRP